MKLRVLATALIAGSVLFSGLAKADKLDDIKQAGVVRIAIFDSNPPFGFIDPQTKKLAGYDADIANEIAKDLGVKLELRPTNPANRIPLLSAKSRFNCRQLHHYRRASKTSRFLCTLFCYWTEIYRAQRRINQP